MSSSSEIRALFVGVGSGLAKQLAKLIEPAAIRHLTNADEFAAFVESPPEDGFHLAIGGMAIEGVSIQEIAQAIRGVLGETPFFYCAESGEQEYNRANFIKNGFTDAFLLPLDHGALKAKIEESICRARNVQSYRSIKVVDLQPELALGFDLYILLPQNNKYIRLVHGDDSIDAKRIDRLKAHQNQSAFVPVQQMQKFYDYSAQRLKALSSPSGSMSETERKERLQSAVRDLVGGIFTTGSASGFNESKQMMAEAGKIVETFVTRTEVGDWYSKLLKALGDGSDAYSHLSNVSTFAALFSVATGIGKPEDLAIAGLFHDLGLSSISSDILGKTPSERTPEEKKAYERHPELTVQILNQRKLIISKDIQTIILQHHERFSGNGYPHGLLGPKVKLESQILGFADEFDYLTSLQPGRPRILPDKALEMIRAQQSFNPELISKLSGLFPAKRDAA